MLLELSRIDANRKVLLALHAVLFIISLYPIMSVDVPPLTDYLNHLARGFIIYNEPRLPAVNVVYDVHWEVAPYLALDVLMFLFQHVTDVYTAGKLFIILSFLLIVIGVLGLSRHIYTYPSYVTLLIYPFFYNTGLLWGFVNFIFGIGVALVSFVVWLKFRKQLTPFRMLLFFIILNINYFSHAISYAILGLTIIVFETFSYDLRHKQERKRYLSRVLLLACMVLPQAALWLFSPKDVLVQGTQMGDIFDLLKVVGAPILFNVSAIEVAILILALVLLRFPKAQIESNFANTTLVLAILSLIIPLRLLGIYLTDIRIPLFLIFFVFGVCHINMARIRAHKLWYGMLVMSIIAISSFRYVTISENIQQCSQLIDEFRTEVHDTLHSSGAPVLTLMSSEALGCPYGMAFNHLRSLMVVESQLFVPEIFTIIPPVKVSAEYLDYLDPDKKYSHAEYYKYLVAMDGNKDNLFPASWKLITKGSFFTIYENTSFEK